MNSLVLTYLFIWQKANADISVITVILIILVSLTLIYAANSFIPGINPAFLRIPIPIKFGFLPQNGKKLKKSLTIASGDAAKPINFKYINKSRRALVDVVIDQKIKRPLALSATGEVTREQNGNQILKEEHGDNPAGGYYNIKLIDLLFSGKQEKEFLVELNTQGNMPGDYEIEITCYSKSQNYKYKKGKLKIKIQ